MKSLIKPVGGAIIGVTIPIGLEYVAKGGRLGATEAEPTKGVKISGVVGTGLGLIEIGLAYGGHKGKIASLKEEEDVALFASMGGASLATGVSILILDELRKRAAYAFRRKSGERLPTGRREDVTPPGLERIEYPVETLVEEI